VRTPQPNDTLDMIDATNYWFTRRTWVNAHPDDVYDLISDVSRISAWSPNASEVRYDDNGGPQVGAWFSGRNQKADKSWTSRSQVCTADRGAAFGFVVGGIDDGIVHWQWTFRPSGSGTEVQQAWRLLRTDPLLGATRSDLDNLRDYMTASVEATLLALARWIGENTRTTSAATPA
jgi:ribosome-associated toxin RatA of RatAB toxin-antitoxin module